MWLIKQRDKAENKANETKTIHVYTIQISKLNWALSWAERRKSVKAKAKKWPSRWRHERVELVALS